MCLVHLDQMWAQQRIVGRQGQTSSLMAAQHTLKEEKNVLKECNHSTFKLRRLIQARLCYLERRCQYYLEVVVVKAYSQLKCVHISKIQIL